MFPQAMLNSIGERGYVSIGERGYVIKLVSACPVFEIFIWHLKIRRNSSHEHAAS